VKVKDATQQIQAALLPLRVQRLNVLMDVLVEGIKEFLHIGMQLQVNVKLPMMLNVLLLLWFVVLMAFKLMHVQI
jgi:hypothetical protein